MKESVGTLELERLLAKVLASNEVRCLSERRNSKKDCSVCQIRRQKTDDGRQKKASVIRFPKSVLRIGERHERVKYQGGTASLRALVSL